MPGEGLRNWRIETCVVCRRYRDLGSSIHGAFGVTRASIPACAVTRSLRALLSPIRRYLGGALGTIVASGVIASSSSHFVEFV